jgi:hypothetical protein
VALELGDVVPAPLPMVRVVAVSPYTVELHALRALRVQHMRGGVQALGDLAAHVDCSSGAAGGRRRDLAGGTVAERR